jgi:hypothetical protein
VWPARAAFAHVDDVTLDRPLVEQWAGTALANVNRRYPYKLDQILTDSGDLAAPDAIHPAFWGSYDWHSCVHMHWTLARLLRRQPSHRLAAATHEHFSKRLTSANVAGEGRAFERPQHPSFERPYGWGWLLKLAAELRALAADQPECAPWFECIAPLADTVAERLLGYLPRVDYPTRAGNHGNTAFALLLALDYCDAVQHRALTRLIGERAQRWFGRDRGYPADYEPSGDDFLSGGLIEAALMKRVLDGCGFADWWEQFRPGSGAVVAWLAPVAVADPSDPKIVHLHGLNLSRAWCWRQLLPALPAPLADQAARAAESHIMRSLPAALSGEYVGTHWLASFALLAVDGS